MKDTFEALSSFLSGTRIDLRADECTERSHRRLLLALMGLTSGAAVGPGDLAALVRHLLRREQERQGGVPQDALVPRTASWPSREVWERAGLEVDEHSSGAFRVEARAWMPSWLPDASGGMAEKSSFAETTRRSYSEVQGDPFLSVVEKRKYRSAGQRASVRSVLTCPAGATLVVNLPTGSGKSLCAQVPALLGSESQGVTVVVMPTTALCIDQEDAIRRFVSHPTAYYGGSRLEQRDRNAAIRKRIGAGTQRIVFASPESVLGALAHAVYKAASTGLLRFLVVDEAHMVEQWGDEFRSAFQELAGMRLDLLRQCPGPAFRTVLLTATLTESCLDALEVLFAQPGPFAVLSAVQLRPEPSYWFARCSTESEKQRRVLEALHHLPRPLILYVTRVRDANAWHDRVRTAGYSRCEVVTGATPDEHRRAVLDRWRNDQIDLIVATSAFGLGVDKEDVRAIVHACVPENVDRYYQEVGRGGRDGQASVSLVVYTDEDLKVAEGLNKKKIVGIERGRERWLSMFENKEMTSEPGRYRLRIDVPPSYELGDIDMLNDYNVAWNVRTLTLMARSRLIELDADPPPTIKFAEALDPDVHEADFEAAIAQYQNTRVVRVLHQDHQSEATWMDKVEAERQRARCFASRNLSLMREVLDAKRCVSDVLSNVYSIGIDAPAATCRVWVATACGGCPYCRQRGHGTSVSPLPVPPTPWGPTGHLGSALGSLVGEEKVLAIFYEPPTKRREERVLEDVLTWFAEQGVQNFIVPPPYFDLAWAALEQRRTVVFISDLLDPVTALEFPRAPTLILHPPDQSIPGDLYIRRPAPNRERAPRILFFPTAAVDPRRDGAALRDHLRYPSLVMDELRTRYSL